MVYDLYISHKRNSRPILTSLLSFLCFSLIRANLYNFIVCCFYNTISDSHYYTDGEMIFKSHIHVIVNWSEQRIPEKRETSENETFKGIC